MQKTYKNILSGYIHLLESIGHILTCGASDTPLNTQPKISFKPTSLKSIHQGLLSDMNACARDVRQAFGLFDKTIGSYSINEKTTFVVNNRPAVIDYKTHTLRWRQRD